MIKVCYVLSTSDATGGANRSLMDLLRNIDRKTVEPIALIRRHGPVEESLKAIHVPYQIFPYTNAVVTGNALKDALKEVAGGILTQAIKRYLKREGIQIVHNNSVPVRSGMEAARSLGIPCVCHIRENIWEGLNEEFLDPDKHLETINQASVIIAISEYIRNGYRLNESKTIVLNDGIDTGIYYDEKTILDQAEIHMSLYGAVNKQKGQMIAVKAMKRLQEKGYDHVFLNIVGNMNSDYGQMVQQYVQQKQVSNVTFIPIIQRLSSLKEFRKKDDINLVCSNAEGLGRITIESMLSNTLTIGADAGATPEIIEDEFTGLLFRKDDPDSLADRIIYAIHRKVEMQEIADRGRAFAAERFDIRKYADTMTEIYRKLIKT